MPKIKFRPEDPNLAKTKGNSLTLAGLFGQSSSAQQKTTPGLNMDDSADINVNKLSKEQ